VWNYPLFEAASRGKSIVATGFSGPVEYLDPSVHHLVRHRSALVRLRYAYYSTAMHRAEPNVPHAAETMRAGSAARIVAGERIRPDFSPEAIGRVARQSLLHLLRPTSAAKWRRIDSHDRLSTLGPPVPIPGEWCDADYFEHGLMSNWTDGYTWKAFAGLFRDTAEFLTAMFPEAESFLDAGCAKGFLVRSLRKRGKQAWGFDHSAWAIEHAEESARPFVHRGWTTWNSTVSPTCCCVSSCSRASPKSRRSPFSNALGLGHDRRFSR
jgi:hypothetical protein